MARVPGKPAKQFFKPGRKCMAKQTAKVDLSGLDIKDLKKLRKDVDKAIASFEKRKLEEARAAVEAKARELGFSLNELTGKSSAPKAKNPPKYRNPDNPDQTWTGRGRQPAWVKAYLKAGKPLDAITI